MEQTQITAQMITQQIMCPEFHGMLWQKQNSPTNCVPTSMQMILRARGSFVNPPDAGPQGVREGSEAESMAMLGGFKIVSASQYTQNVPKAAAGYSEALRRSAFIAIRRHPQAGFGHPLRDYNHAVVVVGVSQVQNDWWVHFYDPGLPDPAWKKLQSRKLADFAEVIEEWWVPD